MRFNQTDIINKMNDYLVVHCRKPLDTRGHCNGFVKTWGCFVSMGKEKKFWDIIKQIYNWRNNDVSKNEVENLIEAVKTFQAYHEI